MGWSAFICPNIPKDEGGGVALCDKTLGGRMIDCCCCCCCDECDCRVGMNWGY